MKYTFLLLLASFILIQPSVAQDANVKASVSSTTIGTEEGVSFTIEVEGVSANEVQRPQAPVAEGLTLAQPVASTQTSVSIVNGRMSQSVSFEWVYRANGEGTAQIGSTEVVAKGKTFVTQPIDITVVPQAQRPQRQARQDPFNPFGSLRRPTQQKPLSASCYYR